jgi:hypothetical protein
MKNNLRLQDGTADRRAGLAARHEKNKTLEKTNNYPV